MLIVDASSESDFSAATLDQIDSILVSLGFKKEVRSVLNPGRQVLTTYEGPEMPRDQIESALGQIAAEKKITLSIEVEESVKFP